MSTIPVDLAIEDELSEAVLRRVLASVGRGYSIGRAYGRSGFSYLKTTIKGWNRAARGRPFVLLTDLDDSPCPSALIQDWLREPKHPNLMFRVAVREVESWLLADGESLAKYPNVRVNQMPRTPDSLPDPKTDPG